MSFPNRDPHVSSPNLFRSHSNLDQADQTTPGKHSHRTGNRSIDPATPTGELKTGEQFDIIATQVNETIDELNLIYNEIGYSAREITSKKHEIFQVLHETIQSFTSSLQREKSNIGNECEWLRQQIRIILAMLNDPTGEKTLKLYNRAVVFDDRKMFHDGTKEHIAQRFGSLEPASFASRAISSSSKSSISFNSAVSSADLPAAYNNPSQDSPFTNTSISMPHRQASYQSLMPDDDSMIDDYSIEQQYDFTVKNQPELSLLELKTKLNSIFMEVLKAFVSIFKKFNQMNLIFFENIEMITSDWKPDPNDTFLCSIPTKDEAEEQAALILEFETALKYLRLENRNYKPESYHGMMEGRNDDFAFIISSPKKRRSVDQEAQESHDNNADEEQMNKLRDVNYKLVRAIRGLKLTKITKEVISEFSRKVQATESEIATRASKMKEVFSTCLSLISDLSMSEQDVITIQKMQERNSKNTSDHNEAYFDVETLKFIEENPREFGLKDHNFEFITRLTSTLRKLKDSKQKKWNHYSSQCIALWEKLGENPDFTKRFLDANSNLTDMSLSNLKMELNRLYIKRSEYVESFIVDARKQIFKLHEKLHYSQAKRSAFKYVHYDMDSSHEDKEEILNEHEAEIDKLKAEYKAKESIFTLYDQLNELLQDQKFLQDSSKDSSRLLSKNSCKILLNEEKIRKKINKNMPKVLSSLKQEIIDFNNSQLSKGERPIEIGDMDFFEKILIIESEINASSNNSNRVRVSKVSPTKIRNASQSRNVSPTKARSPAKVTKDRARKGISPTRVGKVTKPATNTQADFSNKRVHDDVGNTAEQRPWRRPPSREGHMSLNSSPTVAHSSRGTLPRLATLQPLNSPLAPGKDFGRTLKEPRIDNNSDNSTLYSMCSRVSPLRTASQNTAIKTSFSPIKVSGSNYIDVSDNDKENSIYEERYGLSPIRVTSKSYDNDKSRASVGSLANSTMIGDEYQLWREERIREINNS